MSDTGSPKRILLEKFLLLRDNICWVVSV